MSGFRVLMGFSFTVAPWRAALFLLAGVVMSLIDPALSRRLRPMCSSSREFSTSSMRTLPSPA